MFMEKPVPIFAEFTTSTSCRVHHIKLQQLIHETYGEFYFWRVHLLLSCNIKALYPVLQIRAKPELFPYLSGVIQTPKMGLNGFIMNIQYAAQVCILSYFTWLCLICCF